MHYARFCPYKKRKCEKCNKIGHKAGYCFSKNQHQKSQYTNKSQQNNSSHQRKNNCVESKSIFTCNSISSPRKYVIVEINNIEIKLQLDTASDITIISEEKIRLLNIQKVDNVTQSARSATDELPLTGKFTCNVKFRDKIAVTTCYVTSLKDLNVLGLDWIQDLEMENLPISTICQTITNSISMNTRIKSKFPDLFENSMGLCTKSEAVLTVKPNTQPIFCAPRPVAYAVRQQVENELQRLQQAGIISPVNFSKWAAPIVVIKKADGRIRLCADFSTGLNSVLVDHQYPLPLPEDIFAKLANSTVFSHIDLSDAFLQIMIEENSKQFLTINTHMGLFRYNRMVFGVKTFPAIFQQIMDQMLVGLEGTAAYIDDIFIAGRNQAEHDAILQETLIRIRNFGFKLKFEKCTFSSKEIKYLGYVINNEGLKPNPDAITAIKKMPEPSNISELRSFLGAINFYGKFVDNLRKYRGPLDQLLKASSKWVWNEEHRSCFNALKEVLTSDSLLAHYDPQKELIVAADASNYGLGACILHEYSDGRIKAICHASRSLTPAEKVYSQIEKEALALVFAVTKFHKMVFGRKFKLHTDHKPLLAIFNKKSGISAHQANRLQRWAIKLLAYDFTISFISTESFGYADVLSRLISQRNTENEDFVIASINFEKEISQILNDNLQHMPVTHKMARHESAKDPILKEVLNFSKNGWPRNANDLNKDLQAYFRRKDTISVINDCVMVKDRVGIPKIFQKRILKEIHKGHPGIERSKAIERSYVYWPGIDTDVEKLVKNCQHCASVAKMPTKTLLQPWTIPNEVWERVHIDYAGPIDGSYFLVVIDALSKWPEIVRTKSISAQQTVNILNEIFSRQGLPKTLVSDNGTQFKSSIFQKFLAERGIQHLCSSPYYPMSNGQAERFVDSLKRSLQKNSDQGSIDQRLQMFLLCYRTTPNRNCLDNKSPAELLNNRKLRSTLDLLFPTNNSGENNEKNLNIQKQFNEKHGAKKKSYDVDEKVYAAVYQKNVKLSWEPGKVIERIGNVLYNVLLHNKKLIRVHCNQLHPRVSSQEDNNITSQDRVPFDLYDLATENQQRVEQNPTQQNSTQQNTTQQNTTVLRRPQRVRRPVNRYTPPRS